ncbi:MAG: MBL fold metallo-hydrolase [Pseudomonadota bacterium]
MKDAVGSSELDYPFGALETSEPREIAPGLFVVPLPVPFPPGAVCSVVLDDGDGWTIVDTGLRLDQTKALWRRLLETNFAAKPVRRVIGTHHHPDHIGLAGWFQSEFGAELWMPRTSWLFARMLQLDAWTEPPAEAAAFHHRAGYDPEMMARWRERAKQNFSVTVEPIPLGFRAIEEGSEIEFGGRRWRVLFGHGHAPDHAVFVCDAEQIVIAGDQVLPRITPNIGVYATEPDADPLGDWMASCARLAERLDDRLLIVPGHGDPFRGAGRRLRTVLDKHVRSLDRLVDHIAQPRSVVECFPALFRREITPALEGLATVETLAHLNHLWRQGRVVRRERADGVYQWSRAHE